MRKTDSKTFPKSYVKLTKTAPLYRVKRTSRWGSIPRPDDLSVDRPTVLFMTIGVASRLLGWSHPGLERSIDRSVDRSKNQRAKLSDRSIAQSTGARSRE